MSKTKNKNLVIVESPTKAKTISRFLGSAFDIKSSYGHLRDLPRKKLGIDTKNNFEPEYVVSPDNQKTVTTLKKAAKKADTVYFATDEDREGEAIAWHLAQLFKTPDEKLKRITFDEITKEAIKEAIKKPRKIDQNLVDAQQARRVLDRLVGYKLSPLLWKKVARGLSAGRVQSVAVRLIAEREEEIEKFKPEEFWVIEAIFKKKDGQEITTKLAKVEGKSLRKFDLSSKKDIDQVKKKIESGEYKVTSLRQKKTTRKPKPPFTTSSLQQEANRRFGYSAKQTMYLAQRLYEGIELGAKGATGLITYMRTDSLNLSNKFLNESRKYIEDKIGKEYLPSSAKRYKTKSKGAQEAHEAIRPTSASHSPQSIKKHIDKKQFNIYQLIWQRALASQMNPAQAESTTAYIGNGKVNFKARGVTLKFDGYLKIYPDKIKENILPDLKKEEKLNLDKLKPEQNFTKPPARYSEAGLVKALEKKGIGRPSTYAPTIDTIQKRKYVVKEERRLKPTDIGRLVNKVLVNHFPDIVSYEFTAQMEDKLDKIAQDKMEWKPVIKKFYKPFKNNLKKKEMELSKKELTEEKSEYKCDKCGKPMVIKMGRFGKFLACTGYPDCRNTKPLDDKGRIQKKKKEEKTDQKCDKCGAPMVKKTGRYGPFLACSAYPKCKNIKNIEKGTGVTCTKCGKGEIVQKRSRRGKYFYACNQYPDCKFALWAKPTGHKCPECGSLMLFAKDDMEQCSNKECKHKQEYKK